MLLKKIRIGIHPGGASHEVREVTARFDAMHESVVRTPVLNPQAPQTPLPEAEIVPAKTQANAGGQQMDSDAAINAATAEAGALPVELTECKTEQDLARACVAASADLSFFDSELHLNGLIEIDSSSGSDSSTHSSSDSDDSSSDHFRSAVPRPAYTEHVPEGLCFHVHRKSKILHKAKVGHQNTMCKTKLNSNFFETDRVLHFKYPKCMCWFVTDNNRITSRAGMIGHLDESAKKRKSVGA